jgi:serine/threonine-protein kinase
VNAADGRELWRRDYAPVAAPEASRAVAMDLAGALGLRQQSAVAAWRTRNPQAFELYLRGRTEFDKFSPDGTARGMKLLQGALQADPNFADAYALLALVYMQRTLKIPADEAKRLATEAIDRAMAINPELADAYVAAAALKSEDLDWAGADRDFQRAIELAPNNVHARQQYANWLSRLGRHDEALEHAKIAESLDGMSTRAMMAVASAYRFAGRFEEAIKQSQKALAFDPSFTAAYHNLGLSYQGLGRLDEAIAAYRKMNRPSGNFGHALAQAGHYDEARAMIAYYEKEFAKSGSNAGEIAQIYCGFPDVDKAMEWLLQAPTVTGGHPTTFKAARVWDPLRSDPRFQELLRKYKLD